MRPLQGRKRVSSCEEERGERTHKLRRGESVEAFPADAKSVSTLIDPTNSPCEVMLLWMLVIWSGLVKGFARETVELAWNGSRQLAGSKP